jgi:carbon monoxide dehydrogenase subunit G
MKLSAREDIELPIAQVWAAITDYEAFERAAMRRGAEVQRTGEPGGPAAWTASFDFRGKRRTVAIRQSRIEPHAVLGFSGEGRHVSGTLTIELMELGPRRTRMIVGTEVRPMTLAARLFLQSLKLARARVVKRYQSRIAQLATMIESRARGQKSGF